MFASSILLPALSFAALASAALAPRTSCSSGEFLWTEKSCCLPIGGKSSPSTPPAGLSCPLNFYFHSGYSACVPYEPTTPTPSNGASCGDSNVWSSGDLCCKAPTPTTPTCSKDEFLWSEKSCCLPTGGEPNPPSPPSGKTCPSTGYQWHPDYSCCVPTSPTPPTPTCKSGWGWTLPDLCCIPNPSSPQPSRRAHTRRDLHRTSDMVMTCPWGLKACPVGLFQGDWECIDPMQDLHACGGCATTGLGQDCGSIVGAKDVECEAGSCSVYTCLPGYTLGSDGKSCIAH